MKSLEEYNFKYLSGIKPTGEITLGNYLGVIKPAVDLNEVGERVLMFIADLHAFTTSEYSKNVDEHKRQLMGLFDYFGIDYFIQSRIPEHTQLGFFMEFIAKDWELRNQIQYREKKGRDTRVSLMTYPALMAADCLMYDIPNVLVGEDQMPHMYLTKDLQERFNKEIGENVLVMPKSVNGDFPKIMDLKYPDRKMSKSSGETGCIFLLEDPEEARKKILRAVTDSENIVRYDPINKPGVSNLMRIYSGLTGIDFHGIELIYGDMVHPYGEFKKMLAEEVVDLLTKIQKHFNTKEKFINNYQLERNLKRSAEEKMEKVLNAVGKIK